MLTSQRLSCAAVQCIDGFDSAANQAIALWRTGGQSLGQAARVRWDTAFEQSAAQLSEETRRNATHARDVVGTYYTRAVALSTSGAEVAVATLVQAARVAVDRASAWQQSRA